MSDTYTRDEARAIVADLKESGDVLRFGNIGASPFFWYNPYTNNDGVLVRNWDCLSYYFERRAGKSLLSYPHLVRPWKNDDYAVNRFSDPWVVSRIMKHRRHAIEVIPFDESPFSGGVITDWD